MQYTFYRQYGNKIELRYKEDGSHETKSVVIDNFQPTLFTTTGECNSRFKTIFGEPLTEITFDGIKDAKQYVNTFSDVDGSPIHGNSNYAMQFITELYEGQPVDYDPSLIRVAYTDIEVDMGDQGGFPHPHECKAFVNAITVYDNIDDAYYVFGLPIQHPDGHMQTFDVNNPGDGMEGLDIRYMEFTTERELLHAYLSHMKEKQYDVFTGWYSSGFDLPYIVFRCNKLFGESKTKQMLSPFNNIRIVEKSDSYGKPVYRVVVDGLSSLDYKSLYEKHTYEPRESYSLDYISYIELGEHKVSYKDVGDLRSLYRLDYHKFIRYNITDVKRVKQLNDKLKLLDVTYDMSYFALCNFEDTLGTVLMWDCAISRYLYSRGVAPLFSRVESAPRDYPGGYVKAPIPGKYGDVLTIDLNSLYPHILMGQNIGPETRVPEHLRPEGSDIYYDVPIEKWVNGEVDTSIAVKAGYTICPNGEMYYRDRKSFMSEMVEMIYSGRKADKGQMFVHEKEKIRIKEEIHELGENPERVEAYNYHAMQEVMYGVKQMTKKILINSLYGALANQYFKYGLVENAEAITLYGQLVNKYTQRRVNELFNGLAGSTKTDYCIMGDTDSNYYDVTTFANMLDDGTKGIQHRVDRIDEFHKTVLGPEVDSYMEDLATYMNSYANKMVWEREIIASACIIIAKKNYAMAVWDKEGVRYHEEPKLKVTGLEAVKSETPEWSRNLLKECYMISLQKDEAHVQEAIKTAYNRMRELPVEDIAISKSVNNIGKYFDPVQIYSKGCVQNVRAAINYNQMLKRHDLLSRGEIRDGDKIKMIPLVMPNPSGQPIIGFLGNLPSEFGLDEYIDYETIFRKSFKKPITRFLDAIGWHTEHTYNIMDFLVQ